MSYVNQSFETGFELSETAPTLGKDEPLTPRNTITQEIDDAGFKATLDRVQYGTHKDQPACLLTFTFLFFWKRNTSIRFQSACITIRFNKSPGAGSMATVVPPGDNEADDARNVPHIIYLMPQEVYGTPSTKQVETGRRGKGGVQVPGPGATGGLEVDIWSKSTQPRDVRMNIHGRKKSPHFAEEENIAIWEITENKIQCDGIPGRFQAAIVLRWPAAGGGVTANLTVEPELAFPVWQPWHVIKTFQLRQRRNDPIMLDGKTSKGDPVDSDIDFANKSYKWPDVIKIPTEYENILLLQ